MAEPGCTPGQTAGPFLHLGLSYPGDRSLVDERHPQAVWLHGTVYDGARGAVPDAVVELWQPGPDGRIPRRDGSLRRDRPEFTGWGRCATDAAGRYSFTTLSPGPPGPGRAPFFALVVFARGLLDRLFTRAYLPGAGQGDDPLLAAVDAERRATLLCTYESDSGETAYRFDIHLQGPGETVFLTYRDGRR